MAKTLSRNAVHTSISILFVISGALGLVYQIVWFKYLSLFLGNTTYAQTVVLATFMGGLALGSAWWGRKVDRVKYPLRLYAILELGIGVYGLLYPQILAMLKSAFISIIVSLQLPSDGTTVLLLKFLTSLCSLLIPTILMGGTLPILVRFISDKMEESGKNIAVLYFLNSFGAVAGSLLAGFFFIRLIGLSATIATAAVMNLFIGGLALLLSLAKTEQTDTTVEPPMDSEIIFSRRQVMVAIIVAGISGFASMIYEVTWVRFLIPVLGSSTYSFSLMLVAFIFGISIGSLLVSSFIERSKNLPLLLAWTQGAIVCSMLATLPFYARIPYEFWKAASILVRSDATYPIFLIIQFMIGFAIMVVPTIFFGMSLPVATRIASRGIHVLGKSVGNVFAVNTLGAVLGSLAAGLLLIPLLGVRHSIEIGIGCNLLAAILIILSTNSISRRQIVDAFLAIVVLAALYSVFVPSWNSGVMLSGVFRRIHQVDQAPASFTEFVNHEKQRDVLYYKEGTTATIGVIESGTKNKKQRILIVNGKVDATSINDLSTQVLLGQLPCALHENPQDALVIGLGSGVTLGSVLTYPMKRVDCVEISKEVAEAAAYFEEVNHRPLSDPRTHLFIEDALAYLKITPRHYDIIISEPSNPWIAGIGNLYTTEYFEECKRRLNPGGLMVQWFHLYEMNDDLMKLVVRTFQSSFDYVSIWQPQTKDVMLIGSQTPLVLELNSITAHLTKQSVRDDLLRINIPDAPTLLSLEMLSPETVLRYVGAGDLNTEDRPWLEYAAPKSFFLGTGISEIYRFDERMRSDSVGHILRILLNKKLLTDEQLRHIGFFHTEDQQGNLQFGYAVLAELQKKYQKDKSLLARLAETAELLSLTGDALTWYEQLAALDPANPDVLEKYAWLKYSGDRSRKSMLTHIDTRESETLFKKSISLAKDTVDRYRLRLADLYYETQRYADAAEHYLRTIQIRNKYEGAKNIRDDIVFLHLANSLHQIGKDDRAIGYAVQAVNCNPQNQEAKDFVYDLWTRGMNKVKPK